MNCWWVNQTDNWPDEIEKSYLYSGESSHSYRKSILDVRAGDLIMCSHGKGKNRKIYSVGIIADDPSPHIVQRRESRTVQPRNMDEWLRGWEVAINYLQLGCPVSWPPIWQRIQATHSAKHFTNNSPGVQGYLFPMPLETAAAIVRFVNAEQPPGTRFPIPQEANPVAVVTSVLTEVERRMGWQKLAE